MPLSPFWATFVSEYNATKAYWYVPKGAIADKSDLREQFRVFSLFEGELWTPDLQSRIATELRLFGLSSGGAALPRQLKRVFENLGLCWIEDGDPVRMTPAGREYLQETGRSQILDRQVWRYQLPNPVNSTDIVDGIEIHPHAFLVRCLLSCGAEISSDEYSLFVCRAKGAAESDITIDRIHAWRSATQQVRSEIVSSLDQNIYRTVLRDHSYGFAFHNCDLLINREPGVIFVSGADVSPLERRLREHKSASALIDFEDRADCIAFFGNPETRGTKLDALEYYIDISDIDNATQIFSELPPEVRGVQTPEEFAREQFLERDLEDYLEGNLHVVEPGLSLIGRQYSTEVGPIDLLARASSGELVVLELKKGRASDKVFGQICRYMGTFIDHDGSSQPRAVRGYIVCRGPDQKLDYAKRVLDRGIIELKTFEFAGKGSEGWQIKVG